jgi:hypothetical protein
LAGVMTREAAAGATMVVDPAPAPASETLWPMVTCSVYVPAATFTVSPLQAWSTAYWTVRQGDPESSQSLPALLPAGST